MELDRFNKQSLKQFWDRWENTFLSLIYERKRTKQALQEHDNFFRQVDNECKQIDNIKSESLSIIYHELRTPLTLIKGYLSLLCNEHFGPLNERQLESLKITEEKVDHLHNLVNDLLDLSKIEGDKCNIQQTVQNIYEIFEGTIHFFIPMIDEKHIKIKNYLPKSLPYVLVDRERIIQVITNLLSNAIKFTPENGLITISGSSLNQGKNRKKINRNYIQIDITDTGIGLEGDIVDKIFDRFYQIEPLSIREHKGTGLGLAIVKKIIELHNCEIWVESKKGVGSTFSFTLPKA